MSKKKLTILIFFMILSIGSLCSAGELVFTATGNGYATQDGTIIDFFSRTSGTYDVHASMANEIWGTTVVTPRIAVDNSTNQDVPILTLFNEVDTFTKAGIKRYKARGNQYIKFLVSDFDASGDEIVIKVIW